MIPGYSWESLPSCFHNSPFVTIDNFIISPCKQVQLNETEIDKNLIDYTGDEYVNKDDGDNNETLI